MSLVVLAAVVASLQACASRADAPVGHRGLREPLDPVRDVQIIAEKQRFASAIVGGCLSMTSWTTASD